MRCTSGVHRNSVYIRMCLMCWTVLTCVHTQELNVVLVDLCTRRAMGWTYVHDGLGGTSNVACTVKPL